MTLILLSESNEDKQLARTGPVQEKPGGMNLSSEMQTWLFALLYCSSGSPLGSPCSPCAVFGRWLVHHNPVWKVAHLQGAVR